MESAIAAGLVPAGLQSDSCQRVVPSPSPSLVRARAAAVDWLLRCTKLAAANRSVGRCRRQRGLFSSAIYALMRGRPPQARFHSSRHCLHAH